MTLLARPISISVANKLVKELHRHNDPTVSGLFALSAYEHDGYYAGVAIVGRPVSPKLQDGVTAEVTRVCVDPFAPKGTCSMLYAKAARIWKEMGGTDHHLHARDRVGCELAGSRVDGRAVPDAVR